MIIGLGNDVCDARRIAATLERFGDRFTERVFTQGERRRCDPRAGRAACYARRFAAKEACSKALGTGMRRGVRWRDIEVYNRPGGKPALRLHGRTREFLLGLVPPGRKPDLALSLSDDRDLVHAIVLIAAWPDPDPET